MKFKRPTLEELKKLKEIVSDFNTYLQDSDVFSEPLVRSEEALCLTLLVFVQNNHSTYYDYLIRGAEPSE